MAIYKLQEEMRIVEETKRESIVKNGLRLNVLAVERLDEECDFPRASDVNPLARFSFDRKYRKDGEPDGSFAKRMLSKGRNYETAPSDRLGMLVTEWGGMHYVSRILSRTDEKALTGEGATLALPYGIMVDMRELGMHILPAGVDVKCRIRRLESTKRERGSRSSVEAYIKGSTELTGACYVQVKV